MRINNDVRNYVSKAVRKKAEAKRNELVEAFKKAKKEYDKRLREKRDVVKERLKQLCAAARTELIEYAKSVGCKLVEHSDNDFVSADCYDVDRYLTAEGEHLVNEATERLNRFDISVNEKVDEILFKLSLGCDYDSIVKEINNIKF